MLAPVPEDKALEGGVVRPDLPPVLRHAGGKRLTG